MWMNAASVCVWEVLTSLTSLSGCGFPKIEPVTNSLVLLREVWLQTKTTQTQPWKLQQTLGLRCTWYNIACPGSVWLFQLQIRSLLDLTHLHPLELLFFISAPVKNTLIHCCDCASGCSPAAFTHVQLGRSTANWYYYYYEWYYVSLHVIY